MKFTMRVALSMALCLSLNARAEAVPVLFAGNGHYYDFIEATVTWDVALADAAAASHDPGTGSIPGHLVTITSAAEQAFLDTLAAGRGYWIAASDRGSEGTWSWRAGPESGTVFWTGGLGGAPAAGMYANWNGLEPNDAGIGEDVATDNLFPDGSNWNDWCDLCTTNYVIEFSPLDDAVVPEPATLLLVGGASGLLALRRRRNEP